MPPEVDSDVISESHLSDVLKGKKTIMADTEEVAPVYFAISNIPVALRSADLRNYFCQFIESGGFQCFHYRHRPEVLRETEEPVNTSCDGGEEDNSKSSETVEDTKKKQTVKSCCCVVAVRGKEAERFIKMYAGNNWIDSKGNWLARRCVIKRVKVSSNKGLWDIKYELSECA